MKSFSLLRTNVALTTNYKLMVTSDYGLYFDSIDSMPDLNVKKLKKIQINKENVLEYTLPKFWSNTPYEMAYYVKDNDDVDVMYSDFTNQYDTIYHCGGRNISNNQDYSEEFEYFAPLHISKGYLPKYFVIFRIDGPGLIKLTKNEFRKEILDKMKVVKVFDMTRATDLGKFLYNSIDGNKNFPTSVCEIDFEDLYSSIFGIKYPMRGSDSGFIEHSFFSDFRKEYNFYDLQKYVTDKFRNGQVIYSSILNLSFLFDDTPATPTSLRKWSLNRYLGFYFDQMELAIIVSPTRLYGLKNDVYIDKENFLVSVSGGSPFENETMIDIDNLYININKNIYKILEYVDLNTYEKTKTNINSNSFVDRYVRKEVKKYKIISDTKLYLYSVSTDALLNNVIIKNENDENLIYSGDGLTPYSIDNFDDYDMWIIKIDEQSFKLTKNVDNFLKINTDHAFVQTDNTLEYYINDPEPNFKKTYNISLKETKEPLKFYIYRCQFTDIKDFDNDFIDTEFAKFEYENDDGLTITDESKLYVHNKKTNSVDDFKFGSDVVNIPVSSEYTANDETFKLSSIGKNGFQLNGLWKKNPNFVKWGFKNSFCSNNYPYLLNNSITADPFNRSTNFYEPAPKRVEKNLDYFFSINSDGKSYTHHSLHVESRSGMTIDKDFKFELDKYLGLDENYKGDYFSYFFSKRDEFLGGKIKKNVKKWSYFNGGQYETNTTVFKGLKLMMLDVIDATNLKEITVTNTQKFTDYKFSILLSKNEFGVTVDPSDPNLALVEQKVNTLKWVTIDQWKSGKPYEIGTLVLWNDIIYQALLNNSTILPKSPATDTENWKLYTAQDTIFYSPSFGDLTQFGFKAKYIVYNSGEYYIYNSSGVSGDFWQENSSYTTDEIVLFKGKFYRCVKSTNLSPKNPNYWEEYSPQKPDVRREFNLKKLWKSVPEWKRSRSYNELEISDPFAAVTFKNVLYATNKIIIETSLSPELDPRWVRIHSFVSDSNTVYGKTKLENNVVRINEQIYLCVDNTKPLDQTVVDNTLDDGINIYINKKYKNILVNIYVNDNTFSNSKENINGWEFYDDKISNVNRDELYKSLLYKLTASNFIHCLMMPDKNLGFSDKIRYIIVNEDYSLNIYDFNDLVSAQKLPHILRAHFSNKIPVRLGQIDSKMVEIDQNVLKPSLTLEDGLVTTKNTLNYYSDLPIANTVKYIDKMNESTEQTTFQKEVMLYRHNGSYSPIFKEIQLFKHNTIDKEYNNFKFDIDLTDFGMTGEQIISKVNRKGSQLKLKNSTKHKSIYPMLDEIGYQVVKRFIFKSSWDYDYYFECFSVTRTDENISGSSIREQTRVNISDERILSIRKCD